MQGNQLMWWEFWKVNTDISFKVALGKFSWMKYRFLIHILLIYYFLDEHVLFELVQYSDVYKGE